MESIVLNNGVRIPQLGIGGFAQSAECLENAFKMGYRLVDTASQYGNEEEVGIAIKRCGVPREEIFLTTKLWTEDVRKSNTREALLSSLKRLQVDYVDLYLIHWPAKGFEQAYIDMIDLHKEGLVRAVGVSNFHDIHLDAIARVSDIIPNVNQVESHPYFSNQSLIDMCREKGIAAEVWCPLGGAYGKDLDNDIIVELSEKYHKTPAQIIIRWHLQRGVILFPKSSNINRMKSNMNVFDFTLEKSDMDAINALDTGVRMGPDPENFDF